MEKKILLFDKFKTLEKKKNQSYDYGCIMGYFETDIQKCKIDKDDLYNNEENEFGLEVEPHVSILFGLHDDEIKEEEVTKLFTMIECPEITAAKISLFENDKYDVVKWDIESEELTILNKMVTSMFPFSTDYPDYHAHSTIAYCLPGTGKKYKETLDKPIKKKLKYWVYSKADGKKIKIIPGKGIEIIREAK